jgi:hypothetical protein
MAYENSTMNDGYSASLRVANAAKPASRLAAGPFDISPATRDDETSIPDALITGLLIIYPALATVVAVIVGLFLSNPVVGV